MAVNRRLLAVFAHPDDETFLAGGTIARHVADGWDVRLITLTRGEAGRRGPYADLSPDAFGAVRETELRAACAALGVGDLQVLGLPDKGVNQREADALNVVTDVLKRWQPNLVLTFGPDGISGHTDHVAVSRIVTTAVDRIAAGPSLYYVARGPGVPSCCGSPDTAPPPPVTTIVDVTETADNKARAQAAYRSQQHLLPDAPGGARDDLVSEMFHRARPFWVSTTTETVRHLPATAPAPGRRREHGEVDPERAAQRGVQRS